MECEKCEVSVFEKPLYRVNEKGVKGIMWCMDCIKKHEPELAKNILEDKSELQKDLEDICYGEAENENT